MVELFTPAAVCGCIRAVRKTSGFERQVLRVLRRTIYASRRESAKPKTEDALPRPATVAADRADRLAHLTCALRRRTY
jgi:hypothetical protein